MANGKTNLQTVLTAIQAAIVDVTATLNGASPSTPAFGEAAFALNALKHESDNVLCAIDSLRKGTHALA
jgi:hypothetical protein